MKFINGDKANDNSIPMRFCYTNQQIVEQLYYLLQIWFLAPLTPSPSPHPSDKEMGGHDSIHVEQCM